VGAPGLVGEHGPAGVVHRPDLETAHGQGEDVRQAMRPSLLILRNLQRFTQSVEGTVAMGKPTTCGRCSRSLVGVQERYETWDAIGRKWVGFLECPGCRAEYVYMRNGAPPEAKP